MFNDIFTRSPVNKIASVVVNQCGCETELQLNNLLDERAGLKKNVSELIAQGIGKNSQKRINKPLIESASKRLVVLNKKLKAYDRWHRENSPSSHLDAFYMASKNILPKCVFEYIDIHAKNMID